ncbi:MAG TPA: glycine C-acetyltransferase [Spirochaetia bacterium]|nr:glycine C-acetyltransferase [Spirochaetia bacterium]
MFGSLKKHLSSQLQSIREGGLYKDERILTTPQSGRVGVRDGRVVLNLCSNNYLGLADDPRILDAARKSLERWGYGMSSVRFICGTQEIHKELEALISEFLGTEDTILYSSCFDANGGLFETLLSEEDAVVSDALNHASIIDGVRLCKAKRYVYDTSDMASLQAQLTAARGARFRLIATDGVFSMDGTVARLAEICDLADAHDALVMVDDSHAVGVLGENGRGSHEYRDVVGRVDIITGTLGKALGGASGGYTSGRREIIEYLRQRSRPYLFSNTLAPTIVSASIAALKLLQADTSLVGKLHSNTAFFRNAMRNAGFDIPDGDHPIIPIMLGEASRAGEMSKRLLELGVYVVGFSYPVVPRGKARIRVQVSAAHTTDDLRFAVDCFQKAYGSLGA